MFNEELAPIEDLEWVAEYDTTTSPEVIVKAVETISRIEHLYQGHIRFLLIIESEEQLKYWVNLLPDIPKFKKKKIRFNVHCRNGFSYPLPVLKEGWRYSGNINSLSDIEEFIGLKHDPDFFNCRLTDANVKDLIKIPELFRTHKIPCSFMTFKMNSSALFSDKIKSELQPFFVEEISKYYYYDREQKCVYNNAPYAALKSIRPLNKYESKFLIGKYQNILQDKDGFLTEEAFLNERGAKITIDNFELLINDFVQQFEGNKMESNSTGRYFSENCNQCEHQLFCRNGSENDQELLKISQFDCENTKLAIFVQELLNKDEPNPEKEKFFAKRENRISA